MRHEGRSPWSLGKEDFEENETKERNPFSSSVAVCAVVDQSRWSWRREAVQFNLSVVSNSEAQ